MARNDCRAVPTPSGRPGRARRDHGGGGTGGAGCFDPARDGRRKDRGMNAPRSAAAWHAYGLRLRPELPLPVALPRAAGPGPAVRIRLGEVVGEPQAQTMWR